MVTDTIGDFLARIKNAIARERAEITLPSSSMLVAISKILKEQGYIEDFREDDKKGNFSHGNLTVKLRYLRNKKPAIRDLVRVSKPGMRIYVGYRDIPKVLSGLGISIMSTPKGVKSGEDAKAEKVGGELLCKVW